MNDASKLWRLVAAVVVTALGVAFAIATYRSTRSAPAPGPPRVAAAASKPLLAAPPPRPFLMFISLVPDQTFKRVVLAPLDAPDGARYLTELQCDRVYYAGSRGLCLTAATDRAGAPSYVARVFDEHFAELHTMTLTGAPSRTRLSPDGRRAAFTVFDEGHSYADGVFSTRTTIVDAIGAPRSASSRAGR